LAGPSYGRVAAASFGAPSPARDDDRPIEIFKLRLCRTPGTGLFARGCIRTPPVQFYGMKRAVPTLLMTLLLAGCVTQKIDWSARVGQYTQDQAITDLGPPDKSAKLSDGTIVDEWLTAHSRVIVAPEPYFLGSGGYFGPLTPSYTESYVPDYYLRLTFSPDGRLKTWKKFAK
jgi:hypothetical protein